MRKAVTVGTVLISGLVLSTWVVAAEIEGAAASPSPRPPKILKKVGDHWTPWDPPPAGADSYIIERGDTLWGLAGKWLGDPHLWPQVWDKNRYVLDSHWIYPGDPLSVPGKPSVVPPEGPKETVESQPPASGENHLKGIETTDGGKIVANKYLFACGPWLPKLFPGLLADLIHVTRQEVFFLGVPAGDDRFGPGKMPAWIDFNDLVYGIPNLEHRGVKLAIDEHGPPFDPDTGERIVLKENVTRLREYLARRLPALAAAPVIETRVCQYENTSNGDFLIDRHPTLANAWIVGGGSRSWWFVVFRWSLRPRS